MDIETCDGISCIINVYAPNNSSEQKAFFFVIEKFFTAQMVVLGDFNSVIDGKE